MIRLEFDPSAFTVLDEIVNKKVMGIRQLESKITLTEMAKATFTLGSKAMMRNLRIVAKGDPSKYHHLYEWNSIGNNTKLLFFTQRTRVRSGELTMEFVPLKSTAQVPIKTILLQPGKNGRTVTKRSVFRNKVAVMEEGLPVSFETKRTIVFANEQDRLIFVRPKKLVTIQNPGGVRTKGALEEFALTWFNANIYDVLRKSGIYRKLGREVAIAVNDGMSPSQIQQVINQVANTYSQNKTRIYGVDK